MNKCRVFGSASGLSVMIACLVCCFALSAAENGNDPLNAVVKIEVTSTVPNFWLPWQSQLPSSSSGSGAVIRGGMILTNAHNVADSSLITVRKQNDDTQIGRASCRERVCRMV